jgi:hypothetical protein
VQFTFVLLLTSFLSFRYPRLLKETVTKHILAQKLLAIALVVLGLALLNYA